MSKTATTIAEVIARVDALKPNVFTDSQKIEWLNKVESTIQTDILDVPEEELIVYTEDDLDRELIVKLPHRDLYDYYLMAMIDYIANDISSYQNTMTMFNSVYEEAQKALRKKNAVHSRFKNWW